METKKSKPLIIKNLDTSITKHRIDLTAKAYKDLIDFAREHSITPGLIIEAASLSKEGWTWL